MINLDELTSMLDEFAARRGEIHHMPGSPEHYRQQGELSTIIKVIDAINGGRVIEDWLMQTGGEPDDGWQQSNGYRIRANCDAYAPCVVNGQGITPAKCGLPPHDETEMHQFVLHWQR